MSGTPGLLRIKCFTYLRQTLNFTLAFGIILIVAQEISQIANIYEISISFGRARGRPTSHRVFDNAQLPSPLSLLEKGMEK